MQVALSMELNRELHLPGRTWRRTSSTWRRWIRSSSCGRWTRWRAHTAWDHLPHVDVPTLIIAGERDKFTPAWLSRKMAEHIPGAELMLVPLGTHTAPLEYRELVELRVERFLRDRLGIARASQPPGSPPGRM